VQLDRTSAEQACLSYLDQSSLARDLSWQAPPVAHSVAGARRVHVVVEGRLRTAFLRIVGLNELLVGASADADVRFGISGPNEP
jgi:hypothetical protein